METTDQKAMSKALAEDLAASLEKRPYLGVVIYDPEEGPGNGEGIWLPKIDTLEVDDE
jgi:hypothetical protein